MRKIGSYNHFYMTVKKKKTFLSSRKNDKIFHGITGVSFISLLVVHASSRGFYENTNQSIIWPLYFSIN